MNIAGKINPVLYPLVCGQTYIYIKCYKCQNVHLNYVITLKLTYRKFDDE